MSSLETRSNSALFKRAEQLKRWDESDTNREPHVPKRNDKRIKFTDGCVFLAACSSGDKEEVKRMLANGADINTANVDGLTALHQACIDDNLDMVEFLVEHGADINCGDNEGWTPLHATASCGFLSIASYLIEKGANVAAVNNDGELPLDIAEINAMEQLLQDEVDKRGINCDEARNEEERLMFEDASHWLKSGYYYENPHPKTGATALHVAAAKGYMRVMKTLVDAGADLNAQDCDGWTPLHAAAHWNQREACDFLANKLCNMDIKNFVGQTVFDVADPDVLPVLEDLKKKQTSWKKDPEIQAVLMRRPQAPLRRRTSVTRMSGSEKSNTTMKGVSLERQPSVEQPVGDAPGKKLRADVENDSDKGEDTSSSMDSDIDLKETEFEEVDEDVEECEEGEMEFSDKMSEDESDNECESDSEGGREIGDPEEDDDEELDEEEDASDDVSREGDDDDDQEGSEEGEEMISSEAESEIEYPTDDDRLRAERKNRANRDALRILPPKSQPSQLRENVTKESDSAVKQVPNFKPREPIENEATTVVNKLGEEETPSWRKAGSFRNKERGDAPKRDETASVMNRLPSAGPATEQQQEAPATATVPLRRTFNTILESDKRDPVSQPASDSALLTTANTSQGFTSLPTMLPQSQVRRSFVPPVRDEESETQRKAHAKRVRETRRSTQGVTLDDIKAAQQTIKQQNQTTVGTQEKTSPTAQLPPPPPPVAAATATVTVSASALPGASAANQSKFSNERRPSWKLTKDDGDRNKLEDARIPEKKEEDRIGVGGDAANADDDENGSNGGNSGTQSAIQRKRRPKRRSTGVVHFDPEDPNSEGGDSAQGQDGETTTVVVSLPERSVRRTESAAPSTSSSTNISDRGLSRASSSRYATSGAASSPASVAGDSRPASRASENGEVDYKKLYEESQVENERLRDKLKKTEDDLNDARLQVEKVLQMQTPNRNALSDVDKRERRALERKLSEMEEELKMLEQFKAENQRLRDENGALIRVISKLSK